MTNDQNKVMLTHDLNKVILIHDPIGQWGDVGTWPK